MYGLFPDSNLYQRAFVVCWLLAANGDNAESQAKPSLDDELSSETQVCSDPPCSLSYLHLYPAIEMSLVPLIAMDRRR